MEAHYKIQSKLVLIAHNVWDLNVKILQSKILKSKKERNAPGLIGFQNAQQQEVIDFEHYFNVTSRQL